MSKKSFSTINIVISLVLITTFLLTGCADLAIDANEEMNPTSTSILASTQIETENLNFSPCDLVSVSEMEELFSESPLFFTEENGMCIVKNQWDTRSIWFMVFQGDQALPALQWHTRNLVANWDSEALTSLANEIIENENNQTIKNLQQARLPLYEELEHRWERIYTFGDVSYWIIYPRAFKGIFDVVEGDIYFQIGFSGFMAAQIQPELEDLSGKIFSRLPEVFYVESDFSIDEIEVTENSELKELPQVREINLSSQEIYFGSLCEDETTTVRVLVENSDLVDNVFLVYRLRSEAETNDNWKTIFMNQTLNQNWEITLNAENSFLTYQLTDGSQVEYKISIIYAVNNVITSPTLSDIVVLHCK